VARESSLNRFDRVASISTIYAGYLAAAAAAAVLLLRLRDPAAAVCVGWFQYTFDKEMASSY